MIIELWWKIKSSCITILVCDTRDIIDCRFTNQRARKASYSLLSPARSGEERFSRYLGLAITPQTHCTSGAPVHRSRFRFNSSARLALALRGKRQGLRRAWRYAAVVRLTHVCNGLTVYNCDPRWSPRRVWTPVYREKYCLEDTREVRQDCF